MLENIVRHIEMGKTPLQAALDGLARDRLHHRLDDHLAGRGVHSGAVHGRHRRAAVPRVRGHHRRRHPDLRRRLADADADAVQPLPAAARTASARPVLPRHRAGLRRHAAASTSARLRWVLRHRAGDAGGLAGHARRRPSGCSSRVPKGFLPERGHRRRSSTSPRRRRAPPSTQMARHQQAVADDRRAATRTSRRCHRASSAAAAATRRRANYGPHLRPPEAARASAQPAPTRSSTGCGRKLAAVPGRARLPAESADRSASAAS